MPPFELIVAAHSCSPKEEGEDRVRTLGQGPGPSGAVVCDGVGSIPGSGAMADEVSELAVALLSGRKVDSAIWTLDGRLTCNLPPDGEGATTLALVCAEPDGVVGHFLVGNGAVLEVLPVEVRPGKVRLLWTSIALPQMGNHEGRLALRSFLPPDGGRVEGEKGIRKLPRGAPRLYLVCSDGFLSEEERLEGPAPDGTVWRQVPAAAARLLDALTAEWQSLISEDAGEVEQILTRVMEEAVAGPEDEPAVLDDDTTLGALFLRPARSDEIARETRS